MLIRSSVLGSRVNFLVLFRLINRRDIQVGVTFPQLYVRANLALYIRSIYTMDVFLSSPYQQFPTSSKANVRLWR